MATATKTIDAASVPVAELKARFTEGKQARTKYDENWNRNWNLYLGKHWEGISKIAWFQSEPVYNKVFEFVEIMRAMLADQKWGIDAMPQAMKMAGGKDPMEMANKANKVLDFLWDDAGIQGKLAQMFLHLFLKGTGVLKATFNPGEITDTGIGQIEVTAVDPLYLYVDPDATCVADASYIIEAKPVSLRYIANRWPDKLAEVIEKGGGSSLDMRPRGSAAAGVAPADEGKRVDLYECWYHDNSVVVLEETDTTETVGAKYPTGRYTLMTSTGVILEDKKNPYERFPYVRFVEIPVPGEFWGGCSVDNGASIQQTINAIMRSIIDNGLWLVHGVWVADDTSGVSARSLSTYGPRDVVVKRQGTDVHRDSGAPLPPHIFEMLKQQVDAFDRVMSVPDVLRGIVPSRQPVATVSQQQEAGELRTRERARRIEEGLEDLGELLFELVRNHWADTRAITRAKATGGFEMFELTKADFEGWQGRIKVRPGSTLPMDRSASMARALDLKNNAGIQIPDAFLVELADIPGLSAAMAEATQDAQAGAPAPDAIPGDPLHQLPDAGDGEGDIAAAGAALPGYDQPDPSMGGGGTPPMLAP